ncbi:DNA starvation/stationary phase protection protein [Paenibacillus sp. J31TS4]|uniref:Dps family protein n=1 Tax=Paenibacillus sp. J31TS4 TaxID=2807195 RepID=UPI001B195179|nr:Dps family protein [Paenibacillus sp. J31TS4]GIP40032.1 DNA starvation/stationary phase protection protein [Paenibacillus sp. J31TS4]
MAQSTASKSGSKTNKPVIEVLNKQVANWSVMYMKLHNYHWYVSGENFFTLHVKLEEFYTEAGQYLDELAERMLALNGKPVATMKECLELSSIKEATNKEDANEMVQQVVDDFGTFIQEMQEGVEIASENGDERTADMLTQIQTSLEKHKWMLEAFLNK